MVMVTGRSIHNESKNKSHPAQVGRSLHPRPASVDISAQRPNVDGSVINGTQKSIGNFQLLIHRSGASTLRQNAARHRKVCKLPGHLPFPESTV